MSSWLTATALESLRHEPIGSDLFYNFTYLVSLGQRLAQRHPPVYRCVCPHTQAGARRKHRQVGRIPAQEGEPLG